MPQKLKNPSGCSRILKYSQKITRDFIVYEKMSSSMQSLGR
jgi:hypothetical protein